MNLVQVYVAEVPHGKATVDDILQFLTTGKAKQQESFVRRMSKRWSLTDVSVDPTDDFEFEPDAERRMVESGKEKPTTNDMWGNAVSAPECADSAPVHTSSSTESQTGSDPSLMSPPPLVEPMHQPAAADEGSVLVVTSTPGGLHVCRIVGTDIPHLVRSRFGEVIEEEGSPARAAKSRLTLPALLALLKAQRYTVDFAMVVTPPPLPVREYMLSRQPISEQANQVSSAEAAPRDAPATHPANQSLAAARPSDELDELFSMVQSHAHVQVPPEQVRSVAFDWLETTASRAQTSIA
jgi:hypothetical protein